MSFKSDLTRIDNDLTRVAISTHALVDPSHNVRFDARLAKAVAWASTALAGRLVLSRQDSQTNARVLRTEDFAGRYANDFDKEHLRLCNLSDKLEKSLRAVSTSIDSALGCAAATQKFIEAARADLAAQLAAKQPVAGQPVIREPKRNP